MTEVRYLTDEERQEYEKLKADHTMASHDRQNELRDIALNRFIEHFKGDKNQIIKEAHEYLKTLDKAAYIEYIDRMKEYLEQTGGYYVQEITDIPVTETQLDENGNEIEETRKTIDDAISFTIRTPIPIPKNSYYGFVDYLQGQLHIFYQAIDYYEKQGHYGFDASLRKALADLIERQAQEHYKKPKARTTREQIASKPTYYAYPSEPVARGKAVSELQQILFNPDMERYAEASSQGKKGKGTLTIHDGGDKGSIFVYEGSNYRFAVMGFSKSEPGNKLFDLFRVECAKTLQLHGGLLIDKDGVLTLSFPFSYLYERGYYTSGLTALREFNNARVDLLNGKFWYDTGDEKNGIDRMGNLFIDIERDKKTGRITFNLNKKFPWEIMLGGYAYRPSWAPRLDRYGLNLVTYVFEQAEYGNNKKSMYTNGYFALSYNALRTRLNLPDVTQTNNLKEDTLNRIDKAIDDINKMAYDYDSGFHIERVGYNKKNMAKKNLATAKIKVIFTPEFIADKKNRDKALKKLEKGLKQESKSQA